MASEDLISRKMLIRKLKCWDKNANGIPNYVWKTINDLPSVDISEKTGHWKKMVTVYNMVSGKYMEVPYTEADEKFKNPPIYKCDCGYSSFTPSNYCPDCGLKMEVNNENNR